MMKSLNSWLDYLQKAHATAMDLSLDRVAEVARFCNINLSDNFVITIAGTNGKGSSVAFLEEVLVNAGYHVGATTSPHLLNFNERIRLNGHNVSDEEICHAFEFIDNHKKQLTLTYFEYAILAAAYIFQKQHVDIAILEVGMGGRLDATNIFEPNLTLISNIALDHCKWLGDTREKIAAEKAGIIRKNIPICYGEKDCPTAIIDVAKSKNAPLFILGHDYDYAIEGENFNFQCELEKTQHAFALPLIHPDNAALCLMAINLLQKQFKISNSAIAKAFVHARAKGRLQLIDAKKPTLVDVSHNPHSCSYLAHYLNQHYKGKKIAAVFSMLDGKNIKESLQPLLPLIKRWYIAPLPVPRAANIKDLEEVLKESNSNYKVMESINDAYQSALADDEPNFIVAFGSFHVVEKIHLDFYIKS